MEVLHSINATHITTSIGDPNRAVDLTRDLIWAESGRQIVNFTKISVSDNIYSKDGGVDEDSQKRATLLAHIVPSALTKDNLLICWA